jgi:hypothetical protein
MTITSKKSGSSIKIYINDILHLFIADRVISITSWNHENLFYNIEIQTKHNTTLLKYDCLIKWTQILNTLDILVNHE